MSDQSRANGFLLLLSLVGLGYYAACKKYYRSLKDQLPVQPKAAEEKPQQQEQQRITRQSTDMRAVTFLNTAEDEDDAALLLGNMASRTLPQYFAVENPRVVPPPPEIRSRNSSFFGTQ